MQVVNSLADAPSLDKWEANERFEQIIINSLYAGESSTIFVNFHIKYFRKIISESNSLDPDQAKGYQQKTLVNKVLSLSDYTW